MKERPILFSGEMVRAILDGRKTQTRRLVTPQPELAIMDAESTQSLSAAISCGLVPYTKQPRWRWRGTFHMPWPNCMAKLSPFGVAGDQLWVRETHALFTGPDGCTACAYRATCPSNHLDYVGDDGLISGITVKRWSPSIHMPRWASRLTLEITDVRVERLQDISDAEAIAEGCTGRDPEPASEGGTIYAMKGQSSAPSPRAHYWHLWDSLNAKRAPWSGNPWVWVISFRRLPLELAVLGERHQLLQRKVRDNVLPKET